MQVKLMRVLEGKTYTPVGASKPRTSHFRLVCATNRRLDDLVTQGKMRPDFYYRGRVIAMDIPPLRERMEDIPLLIRSYFDKHGIQRTLSPAVNRRIMEYPWPGNIRELHNFLDRCLVFGESAADSLGRQAAEVNSADCRSDFPTLAEAIACTEKSAVASALQNCGGRLEQSAALLGISLSTLKRKIRQHKLSRR
jgi:DNA-binding NtrC family response regulator